MPCLAGRTRREIRDQDVPGLKSLRRLRPLLSRLRTAGTARDRAGNRRLFMDQYGAPILMSLFSPAIESLRDLQRACAVEGELSEGLPIPSSGAMGASAGTDAEAQRTCSEP